LVTNIYEIVENNYDEVCEDNIQEEALSSSSSSMAVAPAAFQNAFTFHPITTNNYNFNDMSIDSNSSNIDPFYQPLLQSSSTLSTTTTASVAEPLNQSRGRGSHLLKPSWM